MNSKTKTKMPDDEMNEYSLRRTKEEEGEEKPAVAASAVFPLNRDGAADLK